MFPLPWLFSLCQFLLLCLSNLIYFCCFSVSNALLYSTFSSSFLQSNLFHCVIIKEGRAAFSSMLLWAVTENTGCTVPCCLLVEVYNCRVSPHQCWKHGQTRGNLRYVLVQRALLAMPQVPGEKWKSAFHIGCKPWLLPHGGLKSYMGRTYQESSSRNRNSRWKNFWKRCSQDSCTELEKSNFSCIAVFTGAVFI